MREQDTDTHVLSVQLHSWTRFVCHVLHALTFLLRLRQTNDRILQERGEKRGGGRKSATLRTEALAPYVHTNREVLKKRSCPHKIWRGLINGTTRGIQNLSVIATFTSVQPYYDDTEREEQNNCLQRDQVMTRTAMIDFSSTSVQPIVCHVVNYVINGNPGLKRQLVRVVPNWHSRGFSLLGASRWSGRTWGLG